MPRIVVAPEGGIFERAVRQDMKRLRDEIAADLGVAIHGRLVEHDPKCRCGSRLVWDSYNQTTRVCEDCGYPNDMCDCRTDEEIAESLE